MLPSLRSSKTEGQANFVNPGLLDFNAGFDAELTRRCVLTLNVNYLRFHHTESLQRVLFQGMRRQGRSGSTTAPACNTGRRSMTTSIDYRGRVGLPAGPRLPTDPDEQAAAVYAVCGHDADLLISTRVNR